MRRTFRQMDTAGAGSSDSADHLSQQTGATFSGTRHASTVCGFSKATIPCLPLVFISQGCQTLRQHVCAGSLGRQCSLRASGTAARRPHVPADRELPQSHSQTFPSPSYTFQFFSSLSLHSVYTKDTTFEEVYDLIRFPYQSPEEKQHEAAAPIDHIERRPASSAHPLARHPTATTQAAALRGAAVIRHSAGSGKMCSGCGLSL